MIDKLKRLGQSTVVAGVVVAGAVLAAPSASAAAVSGGCEADWDTYANFALNYHNAGSHWVMDSYWWQIGGPSSMGGKNNVEARVKIVNTGGDDPVKHTYISGDNVKKGSRTQPIDGYVNVPRGKKFYGAFRFVFDRPNEGDPKCTGRTTSKG